MQMLRHLLLNQIIPRYLATAGLYSSTANMYYFGGVTQVATSFDGVFEYDTNFSLTVEDLILRAEFIGGPLAGTGWHEFSQAGGGVLNTSGLSSITLVDIRSGLPPAGPPLAE